MSARTLADLESQMAALRSEVHGVEPQPLRYCQAHGVTTQFSVFPQCIQFVLDPTPCSFVWVALVRLGEA